MTHRERPWGLGWAILLLAWPGPAAWGQVRERPAPAPGAAAEPAASADDERERRVMERFLSLLERAPRRGTALDRVYGYHVERGTLDAFVKQYEDRVARDPKDGTAWLMLGLVESQRGRDAAAVTALRQAEATRPDDPLPSFYLGQALVLVGQPDAAAEAFDRALARKPARADLLEVFQALGRVYQRAQRTEQALAVWTRLEQLFPDDLRVQEQIAAALAEESQPALALARYEALAGKTTDDYRKVQFRIEAADLKVRMGKSQDALADFERLLGQLNPESWLHREVRRRIEDVFLRNDDQAGLARYYEGWIKKSPEDIDAMARLGRTLAGQGRAAEAQSWFDRAVKLAPSRRELRLALVEQLVHDRKFAAAAAQYEAMARTDPNNPDTIREWGKLLLRDTSKPEADRKQAAAAVWRRLVEARPRDAATAVQAADLFRQAGMTDDAIALYRKAIELDPSAPHYREYLGEYYHNLKRPNDALATWAEIASGPNRNARNLGRLAEVQAGFGYRTEALATLAEACKLDTETFDLQLQYADLLNAAERFDEALRQLDVAARAADDAEQHEAVLDRQIKNYQAGNTLAERTAALKAQLEAGNDATAERWRRLARYYEAAQMLPEAGTAIRQALKLDERSVATWAVAARLHETSGNLTAAADAFRRLAEIDRRARTDYLMNVAKLEARLGRIEPALKAGRDLLAAAPGNVENYQFFADLCFQLGQTDEGLDVLRRAVRLNEADPKALLSLAETLSQQFRTDEAIEMFWRAFDRTTELDARLGIVARLAALYLQRNQFDRLTSRLERMGREADQQREMAICLAQAYAASGDYGTARQELERLLTANTRDTQLLKQLSTLAESEGDIATAAKYQRQLLDVAPDGEGSARLAQLYVQAGEVSEAEVIWSRLAAGEPESHQVLLAIDSLLAHDKAQTVLGITESLLRKQPANWEALYREGLALVNLEKPDEAVRRFQAILDLTARDDDLSTIVKARLRTSAGRPAGAPTAAPQNSPFSLARSNPLMDRVSMTYMVRSVTGLEARYMGSNASTWSPRDFGQARMAALGWQFALAQKHEKEDEVVQRLRAACARAPANPRPFWDLYYLQLVRVQGPEIFDAAAALARVAPIDLGAQWAHLSSLSSRATSGQGNVAPGSSEIDATPGLPADEVDRVLASFRDLKSRKPEWVSPAILSGVAAELKRAKRTDLEQQFYRETVEAVATADAAANALRLAAERGDVDTVLRLFEAYDRLRGSRPLSIPLGSVSYANNPVDSLSRAMSVRAEARAHADVLRLLDRYMAVMRRPAESAHRSRARFSAAPAGQMRVQLWTGKTARVIVVDFPPPNGYYDAGGIQVLRAAFELYKRDDLVSDLLAHLRQPLEAGSDADRVYARLALCYVHWWNDEKDDALKHLTEAAAAAGSDPELLLSLAELRAQRNEPDEALAVADSFEPLDQRSMQRRELLALRLAVLNGDVERARRAAERLFGLRLDSETQVQLAGQMSQLGMSEMAEAILARARRRAGNNANALAALMRQYQRQNNMDVAVQIAHQILRRNSVRQFTPYYTESDAIQREAIQVLARSGKLKETIARLEAQVEHSPTSVQLQQALVDYYKAAGEKDKVKGVYDRMAKLKPDDAKLRYQVGMSLLQAGDVTTALPHLSAAFKKEPMLLGYQYWEIERAYQTANKFDDLLQLYMEIDIKGIRQPFQVAQLVQTVLRDKKKRQQGMALFRKAWNAYPEERTFLLSNINDDEIWQLPDMWEYVREGVIPARGRTRMAAWEGIDRITLWMGEGKVMASGTRMLQVAARQGKLESLARELEAAIKRMPEWRGGRALLALIQARRGRVDEAQKALRALIGDKDNAMPATVRIIIAQELDEMPPLQPLALELYESAVKMNAAETDMEFNYNPARRLVMIYKRLGRPDEARREVLRFARRTTDRYSFDPGYAAYQLIQTRIGMAQQLLDLGFPADAARLYSELLADSETLENARRWNSNQDWQNNQVREGLRQALEGLDRDTMAATLRTMLQPAQEGSSFGQAVDLGLVVHPRELDRAEVSGMLSTALRSAAGTPELITEAEANAAKLLEAHPRDLSVQIAAALVACAGGKAEAIEAAVARLSRLVDETPLDDLPARTRANARQRAEAARQLGLWLVARECQKREALRPRGEALAARALEAARRQTDPVWALAMLHELGQMDLDRGDRSGAEARWSQMLTVILAMPAAPRPPSAPAPAPAPAAVAVTAPRPVAAPAGARPAAATAPARPSPASARPPAAPRAPGAPVATLERFQLAAQLARLAATHDMPALSLRALREPLRGGPPVVPIAVATPRSATVLRSSLNNPPTLDQASTVAVERSLSELEPIWKHHGAPAAEVYETLAQAVLPDARADEIFLYPHTLTAGGARHPRSAGGMLAHWAAQAKRLDDLRPRVEARLAQPRAEVPARVLLAQMALEARDFEQANRHLEALGKRLQKDRLQATAELASHAALAALPMPETEKAAIAVLEQAIASLSAAPTEEPAGSVIVALAQHQFESKRVEPGRKLIQSYLAVLERGLAARDSAYIRGDTSAARRNVFMRVATEFARAGQWADALDQLGQYADVPEPLYYYNAAANPSTVLAIVLSQLAAQPARERYDRLRAWTLPAADRPAVRILGGSVPTDAPPAEFGRFSAVDASGVVSTATMLIDAARAVGALDELAAEVQKAVDRKADGAEGLWMLVSIARGQQQAVEPALRKLLADWSKKPEENTNPDVPPRQPDPWPNHLIVRACLADPKLQELGRELSAHFPALRWEFTQRAYLRRDTLVSEASRAAGAPVDPGASQVKSDWLTADIDIAAQRASGALPSLWVGHDGHISRVFGSGASALVYRVPLAGRFELSAEVYHSADGEAHHLGYGGMVLQPSGVPAGSFWNNGRVITRPNGQIAAANGVDFRLRAVPVVAQGQYNRVVIQVEPGKVRYLVNGHLFFEDRSPSPSSPWVTLKAPAPSLGASDVRNLRLTGSVEIPRQVALSHADRLDGWIASFYNETLTTHFENQGASRFNGPGAPQPLAQEDRDWVAREGVITGRRTDSADTSQVAQSRLYYHRPLCPGDELSYEFFHDPGTIEVHPALDRLVFLLEPAGVRLHWMTDGPDADWTGLKPDNVADAPDIRRGAGPLPLRAGDWNRVKLRLEESRLSISLNDQLVCERPIEPQNRRLFGFYHDKALSTARVRNVVLRGDWPEAFTAEQLAAFLSAQDGHLGPQAPRARHALIGEELFSQDAESVLRSARGTPGPAEERYQRLAAWVLPAEAHPAFRLAAVFTPTDVAPPVQPGRIEAPAGATRMETGGELEAPALELVAAARQAGRLDELAEQVRKAPTTCDLDSRSQLALLALVRSAQGKDDEAEEALRALRPLLEKVLPDDPEWERWPELVAAAGTLEQPRLRPAALALLDFIVMEQIQKDHKRPGELWKAHVVHARGLAQRLDLPEAKRGAAGVDPVLAAWARVTHGRAATRGLGQPRPTWVAADGELRHYPGHDHDFIYLRTPLAGDFEVSCELFGWREVQLSYGALMLGLGWDRKDFTVSHYGRQVRSFALTPPLELHDKPFQFRLVVEAGSYTAYVNDRKIHEAGLPSSPDPWLVLYQPRGHTGGVRALTIKGRPTVPAELEISSLPDLTGWLTDYYDQAPASGQPQVWAMQGGEIVKHRLDLAEGSKQESLIQYHRPMLEDGEIEYEFYHEPGKALVHPALDRLVLLLQPEGVRVHWLTDAQYDRTGLAPDNLQDEPANRRGPASLPLKAKDWNRVMVKTRGDTVSLVLNGELIYERALEPTNQRTFGLFHYADETEVRVRNVVYRGQWPRSLPADLGLGGKRPENLSVNK